MIRDTYWLEAQWGARVEQVDGLASRLLKMISAISSLDSRLATWVWGDMPEVSETEGQGGSYPFAEIRPELAHRIARNAGTCGREGPDPFFGYLMIIITDPPEQNGAVRVVVSASNGVNGGSTSSPFENHATFGIKGHPHPALVTYDLWRAVMLIICETWEATWAEAAPDDIRVHWSGYPARLAWMNYVSPRFAPLITPPVAAIVEHRPNGGLFLAATDETFQVANPTHMAVAREIEAALQPLAALPWPIDDPYT